VPIGIVMLAAARLTPRADDAGTLSLGAVDVVRASTTFRPKVIRRHE
jgi:hypothetical protein